MNDSITGSLTILETEKTSQYALPTSPARSGKPYPTPIQEAITNATDRIQNPIFHLSKQDASDLFQVRLNNMHFSFRDQINTVPFLFKPIASKLTCYATFRTESLVGVSERRLMVRVSGLALRFGDHGTKEMLGVVG